MKWTFELLAYAAGIIDGEGTIGVYFNSHNGNYQLRMSADMVDVEPLHLLHDLFGGKFYYRPAQDNRRGVTLWKLFNGEAEIAIRALEPYLRVKKIRARMVLPINWTAGKAGRGISTQQQEERRNCHGILKSLNQRGRGLSSDPLDLNS